MSFLRRFIRNEAMASDPPEIYGWRCVVLAVSACFGAASFGMDGSIISGVIVLPQFMEDYGLESNNNVKTANLQANIVSTLQAGCFLGALAASFMSDYFGRKTGLIISGIITLIGVIFQFNAWGHIAVLYIGRFVAGFGVGASSMVNPLYISENAPRAIRGALTGLYQLFIVAGVCVPACNSGPPGCPPYCLWEEAKRLLATLRALPEDHPYIEKEFTDIVNQLQHERELIGDATFWGLMREMWTIPGNRRRALISVALMICQQMTGTNAITQYAPIIFKNLGITGSDTGLFATGIYGIVKTIACSCFLLFLADTLGRRRSLLWTSIAQGLCMFYMGLYVRISPPVAGEDIPPQGYVALVCIFLFAAFFQFGWGATCWIYVSEIPTARLRAMNVSLAAATQWLFNFVSARAVPTMLVTVGNHGYGTYLIFGSFCFLWFPFVWFFIPETKGLSLEAMDELFGVASDTKSNPPAIEVESDAKGSVHTEDKLGNRAHLETV
ncbi:hypothetical protein MRS44_018040 [Fusarium solani]|uniref:uncharacterized protein n=1 Tax=Fusarium solani TaxID=169388 RepID=UPI0032C4233B|nr:hypothetical protein MRS44_018040 [Fusarium solani]